MERICAEIWPLLGALADRELSPATARRVEAHAATCPACGAELEATRALSRRLGGIALPAGSPTFRPLESRRLSLRYAGGMAAAGLLVALLFLALPGPIPELVALTARLHDDYVDGRVTPEDLGLRFSLPGADYAGTCPCPPELSPASPFIVYRHEDQAVSLLLSSAPLGRLPNDARRERDGAAYHAFSLGRNRAIVGRSADISHIWISRLPEKAMIRAILATREGKMLFSPEASTLESMACRACCEFLESRGTVRAGSSSVDIVNMERVVAPDGGRVDLHRVIDALRRAGYRRQEEPR